MTAKDEFEFEVEVFKPAPAVVQGVIRYHPFEYGKESRPREFEPIFVVCSYLLNISSPV